MNKMVLIIGAGIGGLAAGAELKSRGIDFAIVDKAKSLPLNLNNGVHYLHSDNFGTPFPFEFKKITAVEEIWHPRTDTFKKVSCVPEMIDYSMKVMGTRHPSSISDPGNRSWETFLPASNDMNDLIRAYHDYIGEENFFWGMELESIEEHSSMKIARFKNKLSVEYGLLINTSPLNTFMPQCGYIDTPAFKNQPVFINNYKTENIVANWLISLYISDSQFPPYRITIMNNIISMESVKEMSTTDEHIVWYHLSRYFDYKIDTGQKYKWETGRIFGFTNEERERLISQLKKRNIHLLGRFARWDGKLLMDTTVLQAREIVNEIV